MHKLTNTLLLFAALSAPAAAQGCFDINIGPSLGLTDDSTAQGLALGFSFNFGGVPYTDVCVSSNGYIWLGATSVAGSDFSPTEAELLAGAPRICPNWNDFNPAAAGSGNVHFNAIPASGPSVAYALITWNNVYEYGGTNAVSMQVRLAADDTYSVTYGSNAPISGTLTNDHIVGASVGGGALSNLISLAARPLSTVGDTYADIMSAGTFAYAGTSMLYVPTLPGYQVVDAGCTPNNLPGPARFEPVGVGCPAASGTGLGAGDDTTHAVVLPFSFPAITGAVSNIYISSNGFLTLGATNPGSGCCSGNVGTLLAGQPRIAGFWQDLNCSDTSTSGNGDIFTHIDPGTGDFVVTWDSVGEFGVTPPAANTFQIALTPSGDIKLRYASVATVSHVTVAGYSDGNGAVDPGASDLSALVVGAPVNSLYEVFDGANPADLNGLDILLLNSGTGYLPIPGAAGPFVAVPGVFVPPELVNQRGSLPQLGTTLLLDVNHLPATSALCILALSFAEANPGIDLTSLGAPGCTSYVDFIGGGAPDLFLNFTLGAPTANYSLAIPNDPNLAGLSVMSQALAPEPSANALGFVISNGARLVAGT